MKQSLVELHNKKRVLEEELNSINVQINEKKVEAETTILELKVDEIFTINDKKLQIRNFYANGFPYSMIISVREIK